MNQIDIETHFIEALKKHNMNITEHQLKQFSDYADMLVEWNERMNLTGITDRAEIYDKHFYDSLLPTFQIKMQNNLCDVGAGAGFPSIPIKIMYPELHVTIIEPLGKRVTFLTALCKKLELENVILLNKRAEECKEQRENFDIVTARAVANFPLLSELCIPLCKVGGTFLVLKGSGGMDEYNESKKALRILGCECRHIEEVELEDGSKRVNFECVKVRSTPKQYPRAFAKMKKSPLRGE